MRHLWEILEPAQAGNRWSRRFDLFMLSLIGLNVAATVAGTVDSLYQPYGRWFEGFERISLAIFALEYAARLVTCTVDPRFRGFVKGRLRFMSTPLVLLDLVVILPFLLPFIVADMRCLRVLRFLRVLRLGKMARYVESYRLFANVFRARREELLITSFFMAFLLIASSSLMYQVENEVQPERFPNIPATMWWAVATLTTVGYGDVYPVTPIGKVLGAFVAILGIGLFALPTGILGSGFVAEIHRNKRLDRCPHCGKPIQEG